MRSLCRRLCLGLALLLVAAVGAGAESAPSSPTQTIQQSVGDFYRWYLGALKKSRDPLNDPKEERTLRKYVAPALIAAVKKKAASPDGLDADYFLQAQDYLDDWETHVMVAEPRIDRDSATVIVVLGVEGGERQRLLLSLARTAESWKIRKVTEKEMRR